MRLTQRLRNRAKDVLFFPLLTPYWRGQLNGKVICLLYHRVDAPEKNSFLARGGSPVISPGELERELAFLKRLGAVFLTLADLRKGAFPHGKEFGVVVS